MSRTGLQRLIMISCALILVGTEVFAVAVGAGWALAGVLELGDAFGYALMALFSAAGIAAMTKFWQQATSVEPIWTKEDENGPP